MIGCHGALSSTNCGSNGPDLLTLTRNALTDHTVGKANPKGVNEPKHALRTVRGMNRKGPYGS